MRKMPSGWQTLIWAILCFSILLSAVISGNVVTMVVGTSVAFALVSWYLTSYVRSEHKVKRALEVIFALSAPGVVVYEYIITGSLILGVITFFIVGVFLVAFVVSWLLPAVRSKLKK